MNLTTSSAFPSKPILLAEPPLDTLQRVRASTRALHERLEGRLPLLSPTLALPEYRRLLAAFHGFYQPLEARLDPIASRIASLDWPQRRKAQFLEADLAVLGAATGDLNALPTCRRLPSPYDEAGTLGCLYVLEGATLGGQVVSRALYKTLGVESASGAAFFSSYGSEVVPRWRRFLDCLATIERADEVETAARVAAQTFHSLESWLAERGVLA